MYKAIRAVLCVCAVSTSMVYAQVKPTPVDAPLEQGVSSEVLSATVSATQDKQVAVPLAKDTARNILGAESQNLRLKLLHINDHHSMLEESPLQIKIQLPDSEKTEAVSVRSGGIGRIKTAIDEIIKAEISQAEINNAEINNAQGQANAHHNILKLHAGDALTGSLYYTLMQGKADADLMNAVCFDAMVLGNHEFDEGDLALANFIEALGLSPHCQTSVLSANLEPGAHSPLQQSTIKPYAIYVKDGHTLAVIGITSAISSMYASRPDPGTQLSNELVILRETIKKLTQQGIHKIIILSHLGYEEDKRIAQLLPQVDVIVGGHSHTLLGSDALKDYGLTPNSSYPTRLSNADGDLVCVVQAWQYSAALGELDVVFNPGGVVESCEGQTHLLIDDTFYSKGIALSALKQQQVLARLAQSKEWRVTAESPETQAILLPYQEQIREFAQKEIVRAEADFCSRRVPGSTREQASSKIASCAQDPHVQAHGGDIQQVVAYAFWHQAQRYGGADIALVNGGGVHTEVAAGPVTVGNIYQVLPFRNTLVRVSMTGHEIKRVLEEALSAVALGSTGSYPYAANLRWEVDMNLGHGKKLSQLEFKNADNVWEAFDLDKSYVLVTSDFLAEGKDGYRTFTQVDKANIVNTYLVYADAFLRYLQAQQRLETLTTSDYSTQNFIEK